MKHLRYILIGLSLFMIVLSGCDTASQEVSPIVSPDGYPVATYTTDFTGTSIAEGDSIVYTITTDKMIDRSVTFHVTQNDGTADSHDFSYEAAVLAPYTTEVELKIFFPREDIIEESEDISFTIAPTSLADKYLLNPSTTHPSHELSIANTNEEGLLTINMYWDDNNDNDFAIWSDTETYPATEWSWDGATTAFPEIDKTIWLSDPVGTYYVSIFDWGNPSMNYTFVFGFPDGTSQTITGFFDVENPGTQDMFLGDYPTYRVIKVVNDGTSFTVTKL